MVAREPFKPISIDKKLGEIYFDQKCILVSTTAAPITKPFTIEAAENALNTSKAAKKQKKVKVMALADSLKIKKASMMGRKPPLLKIKYSEIKIHKVFSHSKKELVLGVRVAGKTQQYLVLAFDQITGATQLDDKLAYAEMAPKNNLKNRLLIREPSPIYNIPSSPSPVHTVREVSSTSTPSRSREITPINENGLPKAELHSSTDVSENTDPPRVVGLPRQSIHSSSPLPYPDAGPMETRSNSISSSQSIQRNQVKVDNGNDLVQSVHSNEIMCAKCRSVCESLLSTSTSPINFPEAKSQPRASSSSSSSSHSMSHSHTLSNHRSQSCFSNQSNERLNRDTGSDNQTPAISHPAITKYSSSHLVVYEEEPIHEQRFRHQQQLQQQSLPVRRNKSENYSLKKRSRSRTISSRSPSSSSSFSSSSSIRHKERKPRHEHRPRSHASSHRADYEMPKNSKKGAPDSSKQLLILAGGGFKPFSELSQKGDYQRSSVCSICSEVGSGNPREVEIIRTNSKRGPVISKDGAVYMYSTTHPAKMYNGREESHHKKKSHHRHSKRRPSISFSLDSRSSCSSSSISSDTGRVEVEPTSIRRCPYPSAAPSTDIYEPSKSMTTKIIYRLDSSDSEISTSQSEGNTNNHLGSIKVKPLLN